MKRTYLPAALALVVLTGSLAFAQTQQTPTDPPPAAPMHRHHGPERQTAMLSKQLNLTPDQSAKLEPILADRDQKLKALKADTTLTPDARKQQMKAVHQSTMQQLNGVLTPDQISQMKAMRHHKDGAQAPPPASSL